MLEIKVDATDYEELELAIEYVQKLARLRRRRSEQQMKEYAARRVGIRTPSLGVVTGPSTTTAKDTVPF